MWCMKCGTRCFDRAWCNSCHAEVVEEIERRWALPFGPDHAPVYPKGPMRRIRWTVVEIPRGGNGGVPANIAAAVRRKTVGIAKMLLYPKDPDGDGSWSNVVRAYEE